MGQLAGGNRLGPLAAQRLSLAQRERALLQGGSSEPEGGVASWGNLGLWQTDSTDYMRACEALAGHLAAAAVTATVTAANVASNAHAAAAVAVDHSPAAPGPLDGAHVLSLACGAGDELRLWRHMGAAHALGVEAGAAWAGVPHIVQGDATRLQDIAALRGQPFDCVFCVDAAYHFHPQQDFLRGAWQCLRAGGVLAYHQLVVDGQRPQALLQVCARLCGVAPAGLQPVLRHQQALEAQGFGSVTVQRLDEAVLGGFVRHVRRREDQLGYAAWQRAWWRPAITARLMPHCRAAGLGYALLVARKPGASRGAAAALSFAASA